MKLTHFHFSQSQAITQVGEVGGDLGLLTCGRFSATNSTPLRHQTCRIRP